MAFNAKFDCHWLEHIGLDVSRTRLWDCQYAEFLLNNQLSKYPSLEEAAVKYELGHKLDVIKEEYWNKGVDTLDIPSDIMIQYLHQDINLTEKLFQIQFELFQTREKSKWRLFQLHMEDQHCLREMERNGILYDSENSIIEAQNASEKIKSTEDELRRGYEGVPINFDSTDHLSAYLYGGTITVDTRIPIGVYKTGAKVGQTRYKIVEHSFELPRLFTPLPKSELKKEGIYGTDEKTLRRLTGNKEAKRRISLLDERAKLEKCRGTYLEGLPKKLVDMAWGGNILHSSLNQCVAVTGRLSSTNPNQQNLPPEAKRYCISRFM